jgi:hypothetical protein
MSCQMGTGTGQRRRGPRAADALVSVSRVTKRYEDAGQPASAITGYHPGEPLLFAASGLAIAAVGALPPASWAAASRTTTVLRAE